MKKREAEVRRVVTDEKARMLVRDLRDAWSSDVATSIAGWCDSRGLSGAARMLRAATDDAPSTPPTVRGDVLELLALSLGLPVDARASAVVAERKVESNAAYGKLAPPPGRVRSLDVVSAYPRMMPTTTPPLSGEPGEHVSPPGGGTGALESFTASRSGQHFGQHFDLDVSSILVPDDSVTTRVVSQRLGRIEGIETRHALRRDLDEVLVTRFRVGRTDMLANEEGVPLSFLMTSPPTPVVQRSEQIELGLRNPSERRVDLVMSLILRAPGRS